jgi:hypothetical protein
VEPINGELRHGLAQNRVDLARARREARRFEDECELETFGSNLHGLCGAECFIILIRSTPLPKEFKLSDGVVKFNGQQDPQICLDDFITAITISGGSRDNALQLLLLHLKDNARAWLNNLAPDSIRSWEEFWQAFIANFRGTSRWPTSFEELRLCIQKIGESLRLYISRWLSLGNTSGNISPERAIDAFRDGLIRWDFREDLGRCKPKTIDHLMSMANEWADREDSIANPRSCRRSPDRDIDPKDQLHSGSRRVRQKGRRSRYGDSDTADMVPAGYVNNNHDDNHDGPRQGNNYYESSNRGAGHDSRPKTEWCRHRDQPPLLAKEMLNEGCTRHTYIDKDGRRKPAHLLIECREFLQLSQALQEKTKSEQPVAGAVAYNAPPPPPNPPPNVVQQGHQAATIQHVIESRQPVIEEEAFPPPRGFVPMI